MAQAVAKKKTRKPPQHSRSEFLVYKDVAFLQVAEGHDAIAKAFGAGFCTKNTVKRAIEHLKAKGQEKHAELLQAWLDKAAPASVYHGSRGPQVGETRSYRAQQLEDGPMFIKLPVSTLVKKRGDEVDVRFDKDELVIRRSR